MSRLLLVVAGLAVLAFPLVASAEEAADTFNLLYGNDLKRVAATRDTADDLALAQQLLDAARTPKTDPPMIALLCDKVYELALKDPKGVPVAVQAMEVAAGKVAGKKGEYLEKIVAIRQQQYAAARGDAKTNAATELLLALDNAGDAKAGSGDLDGAAALWRRALPLATATGGASRDRIKDKLADLAARQKTQKQVVDLKAKIEANPNDAASRSELIRLYVVEFDNPAEAAKYLSDTVDEATRKYLPAAAKAVAEAPELACLELGDWYMTLSDKASSAAKPAVLSRAAGYYRRFLDLHKTDDAAKTKAVLALKRVDAAQRGLGESSSGTGSPAGGWLDLMKLIDLKKHFKSSFEPGKADVTTDGIHIAGGNEDRIEIPVAPEGAYEFRVRVTRQNGKEVRIYLPVSPGCVMLVLSDKSARFTSIDDKDSEPFPGGIPSNTRPSEVDVMVVASGARRTIEVKIDGESVAKWEGECTRLSVPSFSRIDSKAVGVGARYSEVTFHSIELRMITGKVAPLIPPTPTKTGTTKPAPTKKP